MEFTEKESKQLNWSKIDFQEVFLIEFPRKVNISVALGSTTQDYFQTTEERMKTNSLEVMTQ